MMSLEGKKILFFAPAFFGYEIKIADKMRQFGAMVDLYDERSVKKPCERALLKVSPKIFKIKTRNYYENILEKNKEKKYDFIFVIKCEMLSVEIIRRLRKTYPNATYCLYLYDSIKNIKGIIPKIQEFDRVLSFDLNDVKENPKLIFRPLFFMDCYRHEIRNDYIFKYDISFIGTIHSDRYTIIQKVKNICDKMKLKYFFYCYLQSKFIYYFYRLTKPEFKKIEKCDFKFIKIDSQTITEVINESKAVLDIQHPKQTGLTMRTIEMIGMNKKLITTNPQIKKYDFYNPSNVLVVDRDNIVISDSFLAKPYEKIPEDVYKKYSIEYWIKDVLGY